MLLADTLLPALRALPEDTQRTSRLRLLELLAVLAADLLQATDLAPALDRLFASIKSELRLDVFFYYSFHQPERLLLEAYGGLTPELAAEARQIRLGQSVCGGVALHRVPRTLQRIQQSDDPAVAFIRDIGIDAYIGIPLLHQNELLGTLGFGRRGTASFDESEIQFLQAIASYIGLARHRVATETALRAGLAERDRLIAQQQEMERQIIELTRSSAMGAVATTIAHELNQPLAAAANYVAALRLSRAPTPEQIGHYSREAEGQLLRAGEIIRRIRKMMSREGLDLEIDRLEPIIHEATALVNAAVSGPLPEFQVRIGEGATQALVDHIQIVQVLSNLLRNLVDVAHSSRDAVITVETRRTGADEVEFRVGHDRADGPEAYLAALVLSGSAVSRDESELGLALSRTLVEANGGTLRVEYMPEGGMVFAFTVPALAAAMIELAA